MGIERDRYKQIPVRREGQQVQPRATPASFAPPVFRDPRTPRWDDPALSVPKSTSVVPTPPLATAPAVVALPKQPRTVPKLPRLSLPSVSLPTGPKLKLSRSQTIVVAAVTGIIVLAAGLSLAFGGGKSAPLKTTAISSAAKSTAALTIASSPPVSSIGVVTPKQSVSATSSTAITFTPLVPSGESQLATAGTYNSTARTYDFSDLFLAEPLEVSEQPLPGGYATTAAAVSAVAKTFSDPQPIATNNGTAYMTNDTTNGDQVVVSAINNVLILIETTYPHTAADWPQYLNSLQ